MLTVGTLVQTKCWRITPSSSVPKSPRVGRSAPISTMRSLSRLRRAAAAFVAPGGSTMTMTTSCLSSGTFFRGSAVGFGAVVAAARGPVNVFESTTRRSALATTHRGDTHHRARLLSTTRPTSSLEGVGGGGGGTSALSRIDHGVRHSWLSNGNNDRNNGDGVSDASSSSSARHHRGIATSAVSGAGNGNAPTTVAFADLDLCEPSLRAIREVKGFEFATAVQDQTLVPILQGKDCLARAKTGSGKTIGFLLPAIETLMRLEDGVDVREGDVSVLVLSPTRELATQIHEETEQLLTFNDRFGAHVVFGGTKFDRDIRTLRRKRCDILIATPGRLIQHLEDGDMAQRLRGCRMLVLDEADRLLDMGFKRDLERILRYVPPKRQTLLFSATVSDEIKQIASKSLHEGHVYVDCVGEEDTSSATNTQVRQSAAIVPIRHQMAALKQLIDDHCAAQPNHKIMCFFTTARSTALAAECFRHMRDDIVEIHSRKTQSARTKAADQFRAADRAVMMSSDVTARGIDFPDVTLVIQVGVPSKREQYIHRLGRTARAGKSGEGVLVLDPKESFFIRDDIADLPIESMEPSIGPEVTAAVDDAMGRVSLKLKSQTYQAWLGYYKPFSMKMRLTPEQLVAEANDYAISALGCPDIPPIMKRTAGNIGLKGVPGLNLVSQLPENPEEGFGPAGGGGGGGWGGGGRGGRGGGGGRGGRRGGRGGRGTSGGRYGDRGGERGFMSDRGGPGGGRYETGDDRGGGRYSHRDRGGFERGVSGGRVGASGGRVSRGAGGDEDRGGRDGDGDGGGRGRRRRRSGSRRHAPRQ